MHSRLISTSDQSSLAIMSRSFIPSGYASCRKVLECCPRGRACGTVPVVQSTGVMIAAQLRAVQLMVSHPAVAYKRPVALAAIPGPKMGRTVQSRLSMGTLGLNAVRLTVKTVLLFPYPNATGLGATAVLLEVLLDVQSDSEDASCLHCPRHLPRDAFATYWMADEND